MDRILQHVKSTPQKKCTLEPVKHRYMTAVVWMVVFFSLRACAWMCRVGVSFKRRAYSDVIRLLIVLPLEDTNVFVFWNELVLKTMGCYKRVSLHVLPSRIVT